MSFFNCNTAKDQIILQVCRCSPLIMSRYTSLPGNKLMAKVFNLPCVSILLKIVLGKIDVKKCSKRKWKFFYRCHRDFGEIYLQKCEKYFGGEKLGVDERGEIFKGMLSFMLVGLRSNSHFIINCVSERELSEPIFCPEQLERVS